VSAAFVVVSGIPGSGKSTLAHGLAPGLGLRVIDKDDILEGLFASKGIGDAAWRRTLSRESDELLRARALGSGGAILTSFWHVPGMPADSGTPSEWLRSLDRQLVHVRCVCPSQVAAERFRRRSRHPGHLDGERDAITLLASLETLARLPPLDIEPRIDVDTTAAPDVDVVTRAVLASLMAPVQPRTRWQGR
jgi:predicted kinase